MHLTTITFLGLALAAVLPQDVQKPKEVKPQDAPTGTKQPASKPAQPTADHKRLAAEVGTWDVKVRAWPGPNVAPSESTAVEVTRLMGRGLWLISDLEGSVMGKPYHGHRVLGFEPAKKRYVGTWVNSLAPGIVELEGRWDAKARTRTMWLALRHPITRKPCRGRLVTRYVKDGKRLVRFEVPLPGAKNRFYPILEMSMTRRK